MCGIAAILSRSTRFDANHAKFIKRDVACMLDQMKHRGPDDRGIYVDSKLGLGIVRLAIVGGATGRQPIWNEDHSVAVVCNGEIYNFEELKREMAQLGHTFATTSDVEVIVHLYESYGEEFIGLLRGIFAFVLFDERQAKIIAARDRVGVKPLYFAETKHRFLVASEMKSLLAQADVDTTIDNTGFAAYHTFRFVPSPDTIISGIKKVAPAEYLTYQHDHVSRHKYWLPQSRYGALDVGANKKRDGLRNSLLYAVHIQATNDVKTGLLLSGGLDSTALLALHRKLFGESLDTYTVAFERPFGNAYASDYTEAQQAAEIAKKYESRHHLEFFDAQDVLRHLPDVIAALDEPIADPTSLPLWFACRLAAKSGVKVLYSGEGLDELFNGYEVYRQKYWIGSLRLFPAAFRRQVSRLLESTRLPGAGILNRSLAAPSEWYQGIGGVFSKQELQHILSTQSYSKCAACDPRSYVRLAMYPVQDQSLLTQMTNFDLLAWLPENTLMKSDKISMAHSIEMRVPYLDNGVVEWALAAEDRDKIHGKVGKWMVRKALTNLVDPAALWRKKAGFPIPLTAWIFNDWKDAVMSLLLSKDALTKELYNSKAIERLMACEVGQQRRVSRLIWTLLNLELWYQQIYAARRCQPPLVISGKQ